jgi:hypothetical protein
MPDAEPHQLLHIVFGGELKTLDSLEYRDLSQIDFVGAFPDYAAAHKAWKAKALGTVDNALMRYVIVHAHKLFEPELEGR